ncbi:MAG: DUF502 domain-containing protein [Chitinophagaceae bacterium]
MSKLQQKARYTGKKILQYFLQGLIVIAPIAVTIAVVLWLFETVDSFLPNIIHRIFPNMVEIDASGYVKRAPGTGFIVVIALVVGIGWISSSFVVSRLVEVLDRVLERTPGIKFIYSSVKDFLEAFAGNKKKFDTPVLVNVDATDVWRIGFITQASATEFNLPNHVTVYVPHSYAISGITYFVPKERIKPLENVSAADAMKFTVTGGVTEID